MLVGMADRQIVRQLRPTPIADATLSIARDVVGAPTGLDGAGEFGSVVEGLEQIAWRVAFAAMRHGFDEIGAAVPLRSAPAMRLEALVAVEQQLPDAHQRTLVERKDQRVRA